MSAQTIKFGTVGFLGAGNMASALLRGLVAGGVAGAQIKVTDLDQAKTSALAEQLGVGVEANAAALVAASDVIVIAVKPGVVVPLLTSVSDKAAGKLFISIAAGLTTQALEAALPKTARVVRAMPNTPALVGAGATGLTAGGSAEDGDLELAEALLGSSGLTARILESQMDALTGLSGSGPAFVMLMLEALSDGAVKAGLPRDLAHRFAAQTVYGAAKMALESGQHPAVLKDAVTSPGGTTIAGIAVLEAGGTRANFIQAVVAAAERSKELSGG